MKRYHVISIAVLVGVIMGASVPAHAFEPAIQGAITELDAIQPGMSDNEVDQKVNRFLTRVGNMGLDMGTAAQIVAAHVPSASYVLDWHASTRSYSATRSAATPVVQQPVQQPAQQANPVVDNTAAVQQNTTDIASNKQGLVSLNSRVSANTNTLVGHTLSISNNQQGIAANGNRIAKVEGDVKSQAGTLANHEQRITANEQWQQEAETSVNELIDAHNEVVDEVDAQSSVIESNTGRITGVEAHQREQDKRIDRNNKAAMAGVSSAMAMSGLHYTATANSVAVGAGQYSSGSAVALGYQHTTQSGRVRVAGQTSYDSAGNVGVAGSVAIGW